MARRTFQMIDLIEIYVHWYAGRSQAQIADSLGMDRKTVRKYLGPVAAAGLVAGGPPVMTEADWRARARQSASVITGGPPATSPAAATGPRYLRTVLRSMPKLSAIWAWERPAYQCT